ncbi:MAG TPA: FliA/WhiG family RNA polymerase sigma factor [Symbiobacteriaceae bacterium]|nr:FliA/WhiG family RNA polymerase sigma factor [Symbiobacteriaceae bacterium]
MVDTASLWKRYKETRDPGAREGLVVAYASLVRYVAGRLAMGMPSQVELDDLESYGLFGLLEAIERFDLSRGVKFETYAMTRIRGAIIDGLRADTWAPALRQKVKQMEEAQAELETSLGREPTDDELGARLGLSAADVVKRRSEVSAAVILSLDEMPGSHDDGEGLSVADRLVDPNSPDPEAEALFTERKELLAQALEKLPEKERLVVTLFYYEGLTAKEIAMVMSLSVARISQLHSKAIMRLRGRLSRAKQQLIS